jgi:RNA polymerase sigma factor (sigma-70 family)
MEASALHAPKVARRGIPSALLRLRSDEQLIALFRAGSEEAFETLHDRYRQRLFGYVRQMLSAGTKADAEDVLQDVFVRAYGALRADGREVNVRAWLYRVAHNRCIDQLRRPVPAPSDVFDASRGPALQDPMDAAQRREDLRRLVADVAQLPDQQRSALLMREIDGLAYVDIAAALDVTVPAVKSLLVRARGGLAEAMVARDTDCEVIRADLLEAYERGVKASARARRHLRECSSCREYKAALRSMRKSFAALSPALGFAPLALAAKTLGLGGAGAGAGASAGAGVTAVGACKVAAVVCAGVVATGGAVEATHHLVGPGDDAPRQERVVKRDLQRTTASAAAITLPSAEVVRHRVETAPASTAPAAPTAAERRAAKRAEHAAAVDRAQEKALEDGVSAPSSVTAPTPIATAVPKTEDAVRSGGSEAPEDAPPVVKETTGASQPTVTLPPVATATPAPTSTPAPAGTPGSAPTAAPTPAGPSPEH